MFLPLGLALFFFALVHPRFLFKAEFSFLFLSSLASYTFIAYKTTKNFVCRFFFPFNAQFLRAEKEKLWFPSLPYSILFFYSSSSLSFPVYSLKLIFFSNENFVCRGKKRKTKMKCFKDAREREGEWEKEKLICM